MTVNSMQIYKKKQTRVVIQIISLEALNPLENGGLSQSVWIDPIRSVATGALGQSKGMEGLSKMLYLLPIFYDP